MYCREFLYKQNLLFYFWWNRDTNRFKSLVTETTNDFSSISIENINNNNNYLLDSEKNFLVSEDNPLVSEDNIFAYEDNLKLLENKIKIFLNETDIKKIKDFVCSSAKRPKLNYKFADFLTTKLQENEIKCSLHNSHNYLLKGNQKNLFLKYDIRIF